MEEAPAKPRRVPVLLAVALVLGALGLGWYLYDSRTTGADNVAAPVGAPPQLAEDDPALEQFAAAVAKQQPVFTPYERICPVDQVKFLVPSQSKDNWHGGVATDLMKIALAPSGKAGERFDLGQQQYDLLLESCPECGATYVELDFVNLTSGMIPSAGSNLANNWDLAQLAPQLDSARARGWTFDEQSLAHYLTLRTAGWPAGELGYAALSGAYSSNLSAGLGRRYTLPGAGFYALAVSEMQRAIAVGEVGGGSAAVAATTLELGELQRLLGRRAEAEATLAQAKELLTAEMESAEAAAAAGSDPGIVEAAKNRAERQRNDLKVLEQLLGYLDSGDFSLHRVVMEGEKMPPGGWAIDRLLPAINAQLAEDRGKWSGLYDTDEIVAELLNTIE
jgi:predicted nucleic acid-binding Zn ribbon protein